MVGQSEAERLGYPADDAAIVRPLTIGSPADSVDAASPSPPAAPSSSDPHPAASPAPIVTASDAASRREGRERRARSEGVRAMTG